MRKRLSYILLLAVLVFGSIGCESLALRAGYKKLDIANKELAALRVTQAEEMKTKVTEVSVAKDTVIQSQAKALQFVADKLFIVDVAFNYYDPKLLKGLDIFINTKVKEASSVLPTGPTADAVIEENNKLRKALVDTQESIAQLKEENRIASEAGKKYKADLLVATNDLAKKGDEIKELEVKQKVVVAEKLEKINELTTEVANGERDRANTAQSKERRDRWMMSVTGIAFLICLGLAIYSPVYKGKFGLAAGVLGLVTLAIPFIEWWMILGAFVIIGAAVYFAMREHHVATRTNESLVNVVQDKKDKDPEAYKDELKPLLEEWNSIYTKTGEKIQDKAVTDYIEKILRQYGRK